MKFVSAMKHQLRYFFSLALTMLIACFSFGQVKEDSSSIVQPLELETYGKEVPLDSTLLTDKRKVKVPKDTIQYPVVSALSVYFDYPKLFSFFTEAENKAEVGFQIQLFKHFLLGMELGRGRIRPANFYKNANYEVSGNYARFGFGYTKTLGAKSRLNFGFNYGSSFFNDKANIEIESVSGLFNGLEEPLKRTSLKGDWFEITFGTESHLGRNLYLGFIGRLRILNDYDSFEPLDVFTIPGYGRTFDNSIPAINMYIKYKIQFYDPS